MIDGTVDVAPLAGLLGADTDDLIAMIDAIGPDAAEVMDSDYSSPADPAEVARLSFDVDPVAV